MINSKQHPIKHAFSVNSLMSLTDGVFAIVMTLLVLGIGVPVLTGGSIHQGLTKLLAMWPTFVCYFVTFFSLGYLWSIHHFGFVYVKYTDSVLIYLNIISLAFTSLLPFSTSFLAKNMGQQLPVLIYEGNWFLCAFFGYLIWSYMLRKHGLLDMDRNLSELRRARTSLLIIIGTIAITMGISYLNAIVSMAVFVTFLISFMVYTMLRYRISTGWRAAK